MFSVSSITDLEFTFIIACKFCIVTVYHIFVAVQCERKPIEVSREKSSNCAASTEKIYIRKDLRSPLAATPTFVTDSETARYSKYNKQNTK